MKRIERIRWLRNYRIKADSFCLIGVPLVRLVHLRQVHPLEGTQNPFNRLLILRTLTICNSVKSVGENAHPNHLW